MLYQKHIDYRSLDILCLCYACHVAAYLGLYILNTYLSSSFSLIFDVSLRKIFTKRYCRYYDDYYYYYKCGVCLVHVESCITLLTKQKVKNKKEIGKIKNNTKERKKEPINNFNTETGTKKNEKR